MAHRTHEVLYLTTVQTSLQYWPNMSFMYVIHLQECVFADRVCNRTPTGLTHHTAHRATCLDVKLEGPAEDRLQHRHSATLAWCFTLQLGNSSKTEIPGTLFTRK